MPCAAGALGFGPPGGGSGVRGVGGEMLSVYRVLDLSDERGLLCGHILGQLGADVVHVEPPGGEDRSSTWLAYARGSRSVALFAVQPP